MKLQKTKKHLTNEKKNGIIKKSARHCKRHFADEYTEKYSRGRRGAPAKGVGRATGAGVQISPSPPTQEPPPRAGALVLADQSRFLNSPNFRRLRRKVQGSRHPILPPFPLIRARAGSSVRSRTRQISPSPRIRFLFLPAETPCSTSSGAPRHLPLKGKA